MKGFLCFIVVALAASLTFAQKSALEQQIVTLERERLKAFAQDDKATFERLITDDVTITHSSGGVSNKADLLAVMRPSTPDRPLPVLSIEDTKVRVHVLVLRFTNTYVKQTGSWRR